MTLEYKYNVTLFFNYNNKQIPIEYECIKDMVLERNFEMYNRPCIFLTLSINKNLMDTMIAAKDKATIILQIQKFAVKNTPPFFENYIKSEFFYFLNQQQNPMKSVEAATGNKDTDLRQELMIGLVDVQLTNKNKKIVNQIFSNASNMDILALNTSSSPMIIEQMLPYKYSNLILPPMETVTQLVQYLDKRYSLYDSPYRYFTDFDRGYLLSSSGKELKVKNQPINTIMIEVQDTINPQATSTGMETDNTAKVYRIKVDWNEVNINMSNANDKIYNKVEVLLPDGSIVSEAVKTANLKNNYTEKKMCVKAEFNNPILAKVLAKKIELANTTLTINKANIDSSVLTLDRVYRLVFPNASKEYSGQYILVSKLEIFTRVAGDFISMIQIKLRKLP